MFFYGHMLSIYLGAELLLEGSIYLASGDTTLAGFPKLCHFVRHQQYMSSSCFASSQTLDAADLLNFSLMLVGL
jgi:hypothetical protein